MRFATDAALGKLGRCLRAAGFDTRCQHQSRRGDFFQAMAANRIILTRSTKIREAFGHRPLLFIQDNDPGQQFRQVVQALGIRPTDMRPFSRCLLCNRVVRRLDRNRVRGKVPEYIWEHRQAFHACPSCQRIYWAGSHRDHFVDQLTAVFKQDGSVEGPFSDGSIKGPRSRLANPAE